MTQATPAADFDLAQFHQVFFDEAAENLERFEQLLLGLDVDAPGDETLNALFRCAHSVKGGAATFGFQAMADLTHAMETLLDRLRRHEQPASTAIVDTLLASGDMLGALLACQQAGRAPPDTSPLRRALAQHAHLQAAEAPAAPQAGAAPSTPGTPGTPGTPSTPAAPAGTRDLELLVGPLQPLSLADDLLELFAEVTGSGSLQREGPLPGQPAGTVRFRLQTTATDGELLDLCSFHVDRERIRIAAWPGATAAAGPPPAVPAPSAEPGGQAPLQAHPPPPAAAAVQETLRVAVSKVDQLINLMGELVIAQAVLSQRATTLEGPARRELVAGIEDLERTTRDLQESLMAIRMIPMAGVFNRFPRMLRELATRLGKQVELRTEGESTELDKGMIEKITDPLTHLVRNAADHGIELPAERVAAGKPAQGTLTLAARHEGGCIVIEVRDDGRGLDRERILAKARAAGLPLPETMSDGDVWALVFAPGLSTAEAVTEVSGRGVGMDVVRRNILALGGSVDIESARGSGTCVRVRLPLTLAIMDGMSVKVADELYLLPLAAVVEAFQPQAEAMKRMADGRRVVKVRDEYVPVVSLRQAMDAVAQPQGGAPVLVVAQAQSRRVALEVDELVGQQQVVVKNLEANYRKVAGLSGATIMGDGRVAFILDVTALARGITGEHRRLAAQQE